MEDTARVLEETLKRVNIALESGSLVERKQQRVQENFDVVRSRISSIENRMSSFDIKYPYGN